MTVRLILFSHLYGRAIYGLLMQRYIKNRDFLRPVHKKVKTMTIFVGKKEVCGNSTASHIKKTGSVSQ